MPSPSSQRSAAGACSRLAELFRRHGWEVGLPAGEWPRPDLLVGRGGQRYAVEVKVIGEGRPDRVLPLLSQAILQARRHAQSAGAHPLAIVQVNHASPALPARVAAFRRDYAPDVAVGLVSEGGDTRFMGAPALEALSVEVSDRRGGRQHVQPRSASDLFSDLNQWMLKVLLAPELPEGMLSAPRADYHSVSGLAAAAGVSAMSASRFVRRLNEEGFLEQAGRGFQLVRRRELFHRWRSAAMRSSPELRMSFLIPGDVTRALHKAASRLDGCIGLFAAADMLRLGHVSGVLPYVYVKRLSARSGDWPGLVQAKPGETGHLVLKQSNAPESLFRGAVRVGDVFVSDVLQVWLDVSAHPSRGAEQARFLEQTILARVMGGGG